MNLRTGSLFLSLFLCLGSLSAQPVTPEKAVLRLEATQLELEPQGSLVDAVFFAQSWKHWCPKEVATVLILDEPGSGRRLVANAAALYTKEGRVFARSSVFGTFPLPQLTTADFEDKAKLVSAFQQAVQGKEIPPYSTQDTPFHLLQIAAARLRSAPGGGELPFALCKIPLEQKRDGAVVSEELDFLVFDHDGLHYAYRPGRGGAQAIAFPVEPQLGYVDPCVRGGDVIDAIQYLRALRKKDPKVKARLGALNNMANMKRIITRGLACVVYLQDGQLVLHNLYLGKIVSPKLSAADFDNDVIINRTMIDYYTAIYRRIQSAKTKAPVATVTFSYQQLMDFFAENGKLTMPGDSEKMQILRAASTLRDQGIEVEFSDQDGGLRFVFEGQRFSYSPARGSGLLAPKTTPPPALAGADKAAGPAAAKKPRAGVATRYVPSKEELAALEKKADEGDRNACKEFGMYLIEGNGIPKDGKRGQQYLMKAADAGEGECAIVLAKRFDKDDASAENLALARKYYLIAAKDSYPVAMYNYGAMLYSARGGKREIREGLAWLIVAGRFGFKGPGEEDARRDLAKSETAIPEAEARAEEILQLFPEKSGPQKYEPRYEGSAPEKPQVRL